MVNKRSVGYSLLSVFGLIILNRGVNWVFNELFKIETSISISIGNIVVISCIVIGLLLYVGFKTKQRIEVETNETSSKPKQQKKFLPPEFEIETLNNDRIEWKVVVDSYWNPNEKPQIENFINYLKLLEPYCGKCKTSFIEWGEFFDKRYRCSNKDCDSFQEKQTYHQDEIKTGGKVILNLFKGRIRNDEFDKYWEKYVKRYDEVTGGKYDEYD